MDNSFILVEDNLFSEDYGKRYFMHLEESSRTHVDVMSVAACFMTHQTIEQNTKISDPLLNKVLCMLRLLEYHTMTSVLCMLRLLEYHTMTSRFL